MKINNKEFGEWTADDLQVLLSNDTYRENNFIDYKVNFAPLIDKSNKKEKQALKKKLQNIKRNGEKQREGEEHSRTRKR